MSTVYKNCKLCNAVFASIDCAVICDRCMSSEGELYKHIRDYLYEHPGLSAAAECRCSRASKKARRSSPKAASFSNRKC